MSQKRRCWASSDGIHETLTSERVWGRGYSCRLCIKKWQMRLTRLHLSKRCSTDSEFLWHMTQVSIALCMLQPFLARLISVRILSSRANQQKSVILLGLGSFQKWGYKGLRRPPSTKNRLNEFIEKVLLPSKVQVLTSSWLLEKSRIKDRMGVISTVESVWKNSFGKKSLERIA